MPTWRRNDGWRCCLSPLLDPLVCSPVTWRMCRVGLSLVAAAVAGVTCRARCLVRLPFMTRCPTRVAQDVNWDASFCLLLLQYFSACASHTVLLWHLPVPSSPSHPNNAALLFRCCLHTALFCCCHTHSTGMGNTMPPYYLGSGSSWFQQHGWFRTYCYATVGSSAAGTRIGMDSVLATRMPLRISQT